MRRRISQVVPIRQVTLARNQVRRPARSFVTLANGEQTEGNTVPKATPWPREGHGDNLIDARASSYCFQENYDPEPQGSCIQKKQCLDRAPARERRPGAVLLALS